jgi:heme/copper-type cytochrome/quinol oxidase subunit 1
VSKRDVSHLVQDAGEIISRLICFTSTQKVFGGQICFFATVSCLDHAMSLHMHHRFADGLIDRAVLGP